MKYFWFWFWPHAQKSPIINCNKSCPVLTGPPPLHPSLTSLLLLPLLLHFLPPHSLLCNLALVYSWGGQGWTQADSQRIDGIATTAWRLQREDADGGRREEGEREEQRWVFVLFFRRGDSWSGIGSETMKKEPLNRSWGCVTPAVSGLPTHAWSRRSSWLDVASRTFWLKVCFTRGETVVWTPHVTEPHHCRSETAKAAVVRTPPSKVTCLPPTLI